MKKKYNTPIMCIVKIQNTMPLATSGVKAESYGIGYGGVDNDGSVIPETKQIRNVWDEEW